MALMQTYAKCNAGELVFSVHVLHCVTLCDTIDTCEISTCLLLVLVCKGTLNYRRMRNYLLLILFTVSVVLHNVTQYELSLSYPNCREVQQGADGGGRAV